MAFTVQAAGTQKQLRPEQTIKNYDFDGDAKKDVLETDTWYDSYNYGMDTYYSIALNGKVIFQKTYGYEVWPQTYYIEMGNGERLFLISIMRENGWCLESGLYKFGSSGKLSRIANLLSVQRGCWTHIGTSPWKVTVGVNSLKILCSNQLGGIGRINFTIPYTIKNGKATLSYDTLLLNHRYSPNKGKFTVSKAFTAYTRAYKGTKVYTSKSGQRAEITHIYYGASYAYAKVKIVNTGKVGWVRLPNSDKTLFKEAYYAA